MDGEPGGLPGVRPSTGEYDVVGSLLRSAKNAVAADGLCVSEDEVDGAVDVALSVELPEGEGVEGVLVAGDGVPVEDGAIE